MVELSTQQECTGGSITGVLVVEGDTGEEAVIDSIPD